MRKTHLFNKYLVRGVALRAYKFPNTVVTQNKYLGVSKCHYANSYLNFIFFERRAPCPNIGTLKFLKKFKNFAKSVRGSTVLKFRYVGKSYRVKFKDSVIFLKFNRAHRTTLFLKNIEVRPFKRLWYKLNTACTGMNLTSTITKVRRRNLYTKRGL